MLTKKLSLTKTTRVICVSLLTILPFASLTQSAGAAQNQGNQYQVVKTITGKNIPPTSNNGA